jgi:phosphoenolpyruvate carboxykinase (diphosphate)
MMFQTLFFQEDCDMDLVESLGFVSGDTSEISAQEREHVVQYIVLKLIANGLPHPVIPDPSQHTKDAERLFGSYHQRLKKLDELRCPADDRIEQFLSDYFADLPLEEPLRVPDRTIVLDRHGLAREMALPCYGDSYEDANVSSYRVRNGVLHNPLRDRRTTSGTFHVTEDGLPIPRDKYAVPRATFAALFQRAMTPPDQLLELPFTTGDGIAPARIFVSLLLRPLVCPEVPGITPAKNMEIRFFAPGSLVSNLDFVESIFGNAGDPFMPENDAGLDVEHWTGHTGCVILAPHLTQVRKCDVGLPHYDKATDRQREDGMCWKSEDDLYNNGTPFKLTCRDERGVIVTLIADNYFGYCKKEVKTQLSYSANLYGNVEEEHAGGAVAFASYNLGDEFGANSRRYNDRSFDDVARDYDGTFMNVQPEGYAIDSVYPNLIYIPENARATVRGQKISWQREGVEQSLPLLPDTIYMTPSGYKLQMAKHPAAPTWRLIGTLFEGVFCHKPCTVSGGGKSEISKSVIDYVLYGSIFVADLERDLDQVEAIFNRDYSDRWSATSSYVPDYSKRSSRPVLSDRRSLGSVIKLLTPSVDYTEDYNKWLGSLPDYIYALVFMIKRFYRGETNWREIFTVDIVNGTSGHELKYGERKLVGDYLRIGLLGDKIWRTYKLRQDFAAAEKIQTEDDISASVVVPGRLLGNMGNVGSPATSYKFVDNCEYRLFQRPDDAVHRGLDKQSEADLARNDNFIVNFEPLSHKQVVGIVNQAVDLSQFTEPMQRLMRDVAASNDQYVVCSATPRMINGEPSKNPRYLQTRPDLINPMKRHVAEMGVRLYRAIPASEPVRIPVHAVLFGRRNNPPDYARGFRPLAVYNPIHYQELPEMFMDFIASLTGKSPSTTGAGSEGALTKGPFNALLPITDLNNALVSYLLTGLAGYSTAAGHVGPKVRVDHDISLLIPEIWCRLSPEERDPQKLIANGLLEKIDDFEYEGQPVLASRLGYRITTRFIRSYVGRVFDNPRKVFDETLLKPETQDPAAYADGVRYICEAHRRTASLYFEDGSYELACPPLKALLHIMAYGNFEGRDVTDPSIRAMFTLEAMQSSDWYRARLETKRDRDVQLWQKHVSRLEEFLAMPDYENDATRLGLAQRLELAKTELARVSDPGYVEELNGFLGADRLRV